MKEELFAEILEKGRDLRVRVTGRSMEPSLRENDVVTLRRVPARSLRQGDLVLFRSPPHGSLLLHRVVAVEEKAGTFRITTRGDALLRRDRSVGPGEVLGKVLTVERNGAAPISLDTAWRKAGGRAVAVAGLFPALVRRVVKGPVRGSAGAAGVVADDGEG